MVELILKLDLLSKGKPIPRQEEADALLAEVDAMDAWERLYKGQYDVSGRRGYILPSDTVVE